MPNIKSVIFDLDGVIADSMPALKQSWTDFFSRWGIKFDEKDMARFNGPPVMEIIKKKFDDAKIQVNLEEVSKERKQFVVKLAGKISVFDDAKNILALLLKRGHLLAVATSSPRAYAETILKNAGLLKFFKVIVAAEDIRSHKPSPEIFLAAAAKLNSQPAECAVVEDSVLGIQAAKRAKMACIAITGSFSNEELSSADFVIDSLKELREIIK